MKPSNKLARFLPQKSSVPTPDRHFLCGKGSRGKARGRERRKQFGPGNKLWGVEREGDRRVNEQARLASERDSELREIAFSLVKSSGDGGDGGVGVPLLISNTVSVF